MFTTCTLLLTLFGCETSTPQWDTNYQRLRPNMTKAEVSHLLGQPDSVNVSNSNWPGKMTTWTFTDDTEPMSNLNLFYQGDKLWKALYIEFDIQTKTISKNKSLFDLYLEGPR